MRRTITGSTAMRYSYLPIVLGYLGAVAGATAVAQSDTTSILQAPVQPGFQGSCPSPDQLSTERPDPVGTPTRVAVAVFVVDILRIADAEKTVTADLIVFTRWRDSRLADPGRGDKSRPCKLPLDLLWTPAVETENLRRLDRLYPERTFVDATGVVTRVQRLIAEVSVPLDLHDFPFDRQVLTWVLRPTYSLSDDVTFEVLQRFTGMDRTSTTAGWRVASPQARTGLVGRARLMGESAKFELSMEIRRDWGYYVWKLALPTLLILCMAFAVYVLPPTAFMGQISVGVTSMLTLIAFQLALSNTLPRISYLTRADRFMVGAYVLVFLGLAKAIATACLQGDRIGIIRKIDRVAWYLYPISLLAMGVWAVV